MKRIIIFKYIFFVVFLCAFLPSIAQQTEPPMPDDGFNIFLLLLMSIFGCAMIGAAIIGAIAASLIVFALFGLASLGVLSAVFAVGIYNKSVSAGFKTFLAIVFGITGGILAIAGAFIANRLLGLSVSESTLISLAGAGGAIGGVLLALATFKVVQTALRMLAKRFHLS
ncbi:MAG TPA: hypothetical protein VMR70_17430 [Flavisolibacter sp.]|nr:hypothetical protein [Flavisolibacter sp.]